MALRYGKHPHHIAETSRGVTFAYLRAGQVYDVKGDRQQALAAYQTVLSRPNFWGSHNEARR